MTIEQFRSLKIGDRVRWYNTISTPYPMCLVATGYIARPYAPVANHILVDSMDGERIFHYSEVELI